MNWVKVVDREKLVVGYWELIPMKSGAHFSALQYKAIVRVAEERREAKKQRNYWYMDANWPRLKEALVNSWYPYFRGKCVEACLELGLYLVPKQTIFNFLQNIVRKPITYKNAFLVNNRALPS